MRKHYAFWAIFEIEKEDPKWINVSFPDIVAGVTCGLGMDDALYMASDLLRLMVMDAPHQVFGPTPIEKLREEYPGSDFHLIEVDVDYSDKPLNELVEIAKDYCAKVERNFVLKEDFCGLCQIDAYKAKEVFDVLVKQGVINADGIVIKSKSD